MTQSEKLQKVIERAVKNGWKWGGHSKNIEVIVDYWEMDREIEALLFDHDFAKAYFGEYIKRAPICCTNQNIHHAGCCNADESTCLNCDAVLDFTPINYGWRHYIEKLALTPPSERIDYLFSFIENDN